MRKRLVGKLLVGLLLITGCVTVNVYFPAAAMNRAADAIIDDIEGAGKAPAPPPASPAPSKPDQAPKPGSALPTPWRLVAFGPGIAHAAEMDLNISTPAIRAVRDSLRTRYAQLRPFMESGVLGQANTGLIAIRDPAGLPLQDRARLNSLVSQQNQDLQTLFAEIVKANHLDSAVVPRVQKIFADRWRERAKPGRWIQTDAGAWVQK